MRFVVGDVHGHRGPLREALEQAGLVDAAGDWSGATAELWFVGDFFDRGPDGVGVVADVMRWQEQAASAGGSVRSVLGNHEVLALGMHRYGDRPDDETADSFAVSWFVNGGQLRDQQLLTDAQLEWISELPALARVGADLLLHADTTAYLEYGATVSEVNGAIRSILRGDDLHDTLLCWDRMTTRFSFLAADGAGELDRMLTTFGGDRVVHGHSPIPLLTETPPEDVDAPWEYAGGRALAVDGGCYAGGPLLVVPLDR